MPELLTISEFCETHRISRSLFYKLHKQNKTPPITKVGARSLISAEAAAQWRRSLEEEAA